MAKKKTEEKKEESVVVEAAKAIGDAVGKVAALTGKKAPAAALKIPKLAKKNKSRLPRKVNKAQQKAAARSAK
jgi:hypothetical protein